VRISYLEIYCEAIHDLLGVDVEKKLPLKNHPEKGAIVEVYVFKQIYDLIVVVLINIPFPHFISHSMKS